MEETLSPRLIIHLLQVSWIPSKDSFSKESDLDMIKMVRESSFINQKVSD